MEPEYLRERNRAYVFAYLRVRPCVIAENQTPVVLEFDHVRAGGEKARHVTTMMYQKKALVIVAEIAKCEVRCAPQAKKPAGRTVRTG